VELSARRTALLARVAEETLAQVSEPSPGLRYVIGSEVPIPGGATAHEDSLHVTKVADARRTLELTRTAFVPKVWKRLGSGHRPGGPAGVEFGDDFVLDYKSAAARHLAQFAETIRASTKPIPPITSLVRPSAGWYATISPS